MIQMRRCSQYSFGDGLIAEQTGELWEPWMRQADQVLEDEQLIEAVYEALLKRHAKSRTRGRLGVPAEIVLRMLLLKHIRNWSFAVVEREVRANLVYQCGDVEQPLIGRRVLYGAGKLSVIECRS
jgi:transposase, IS5 family